MPSTTTVLRAIGTLGPKSWMKFLDALPDTPRRQESSAWRDLFSTLGALESMELISLIRNGREISLLTLTDLGSERLREAEEQDRLAIERKHRRIEADRIVRRYV